jgi:hypothetical protein
MVSVRMRCTVSYETVTVMKLVPNDYSPFALSFIHTSFAIKFLFMKDTNSDKTLLTIILSAEQVPSGANFSIIHDSTEVIFTF